jgi:LuxR family transcriptional regulator, maltose regulon positive regulatory protein
MSVRDGRTDIVSSAGSQTVATARSIDPPSAPDLTLRAAVAERLHGSAGRVVVVHAPSGYGKTSNVAAWVRGDPRPSRWVEFDAADNEPGALLAVLVRMLEEVSDFDASDLPARQGTPEQYTTIVAPVFGRAVSRCGQPFVIVLDDVHRIDSQPALDLLDSLTHHVPADSTVVLVGRGEPRVPLARLRLDDRVVEITTSELALDAVAAGELLATMGVLLGEAEIEQLTSATEGWPVGLRLAALALREEAESVDSLSERHMSHEHSLQDYVHEEWLRGVTAEQADFLRQVSSLDWLSAPLCDSVLERTDSGELLHQLHTGSLLVIPLGRRGTEYRMHRLLREVLLGDAERIPRERRRTVDQRASAWFEHAGDIDRAIQHAWRADDAARAEFLAGRYGADYLTTGRFATVRTWLETFPRSHVLRSAPLCLLRGAAAIGVGEADTTTTWLEFGRQALNAPGAPPDEFQTELKIVALRSVTAAVDVDQLADVARAHDELATGIWHALACWGYGQISFAQGEGERALRLFAEGAAEAQVAGALTVEAQCRASLALAYWDIGDRGRATEFARAARAIVRENRLDDLSTLVIVTAMSALVEAEDGDPAAASADLALTRRNLAYVKAVEGWVNVQALLALGRASLLLGDRVGAQTFADEAAGVVRHASGAVKPREQLADLVQQLSVGQSSLPYGPSSLTTAELRVLHFLPTNLTLTEIAQRLYVSRNTAKTHAAAVYRKLGVSSRGEAVELARSVGLLAGGVAEPRSH